jgi:hypothetical protein
MRPNRRRKALTHLVVVLCEAVADADHDAVVGVRLGAPAGTELFIRPTDAGRSCLEGLLGFEAPSSWDAVGVAATGKSHVIEAGPHGASGATGERGSPLVVGFLLTRRREAVMASGPPDGPFRAVHGPVTGRVADACARALGLATSPVTTASPLDWWARRWLEVLAARAAAGRPATTWAEVVAAFPAAVPTVEGRDPVELSRSGRLLAVTHPWPELRGRCAAGLGPIDGVTPELARWMDDPMFARWCCDASPPLAFLAREVCAGLPVAVARQLGWVLRSWDVVDVAGAP